MAETAFQKQYRQEYIAGFEQGQSLVRDMVTTEAVIKGNQCEFLIADSGGANTVTRGVNGKIPGRGDNLSQITCTLTEEHDKVEKTGFNIFASQGDQRAIMQHTSYAVVNRRIDDQIIDELNTATQNTGSATTADIDLSVHALTILGNNDVQYDGKVCALITPSFLAYMLKQAAFASADYVNHKPLAGASAQQKGWGYYEWQMVKWIVHPNLPGKGTNAEKCFMFHESAIGHGMNVSGLDTAVGYNEEDDYSFCRMSAFMGAKLLQSSGVVVINHDGSGHAAS